MKVVVSILNWNGFASTLRCLESLGQIQHAPLLICITDNDSKEFDVTTINEQYEHVHIFQNTQNLGYAGGHFKALEFAQSVDAELFWMLNNDTVVERDTLENLLNAYQINGLGVYGSASINFKGELMPELIWAIDSKKATQCSFDPMPQRELSDGQTHKVSNVVGYSMLIPTQVIADHGFMDQSYFLYYEETDYCLRLLGQGNPSYWVGSSQVVHEEKGSSKGNAQLQEVMEYYLYRNLFLFLKRWGSARLIGHFIRRFIMRFISANILRKNKVPNLTKKHLVAFYHACLGVRGEYYKPHDYLDEVTKR